MTLDRTRRLAYCLPLVALLAAACDAGTSTTQGGGGGDGGDGGGGLSDSADTDGDSISDADEGSGDADDDGKPNLDDEDSDSDGIPDADEAGDDDLDTDPVDSDGDGTADFLDEDSDNNGILDEDEGDGDFDEDGTPDFQDADDDGDLIIDELEIAGAGSDCDDDGELDEAGSPSAPKNCDGDSHPDYQDQDSDGDDISDADESVDDTDGDGFHDRYDQDSDNDGLSDSAEAGDSDLTSDPIDTDEDGLANYRDTDSDNDGVSDEDETELNTDPLDVDSDDDGVSDLVELVAGTDPTDPNDNPQANGDFVFIIPYQDPTTPPEDTVRFRTNIQFADVYFAFDTSQSMVQELTAMRDPISGVPAIVDELRCDSYNAPCTLDVDCAQGICFDGDCIQDPIQDPGCIPDLWTGVGEWNDLNTYNNIVSVQDNPAITAGAIPPNYDPLGGAEAPYQPAHCIASPLLCPNIADMNCAAVGVGCPGFRPEAFRIYVQITDADQQCSGTGNQCLSYTTATAGAAMQAAGISFVGLWGTGDQSGAISVNCPAPCTAQSVAEALGVAAGTVDANNIPFVYQAIDSAVVDNTVTAILNLARGKSLDTTIVATDDDSDAVDATQFIDYLEVNISGQGECDVVSPTADTDSDSFDDSFPVLYPGKHVCWDVHPVPVNTTVEATDEPQIYRAVLTVNGDGSPLDSRDVFFLIPPENVIITPPR